MKLPLSPLETDFHNVMDLFDEEDAKSISERKDLLAGFSIPMNRTYSKNEEDSSELDDLPKLNTEPLVEDSSESDDLPELTTEPLVLGQTSSNSQSPELSVS